MQIEYSELGRSKIKVSRICFGGWQAHGWSTSNDKSFMSTLSHALEFGINFVDTAEGYGNGHSEKLIAQVIKGRRDKVILASKFSHTNSPAPKLRQALERSLSNLGTDYIDLYQQHWPPKSPALEETVGELEKLKEEGKIRVIGVSNWMEPEWSEISDPSRVESLQPCYSLLWRTIEKEVLPLCIKHNISVLPYSPLCQGILAGKFSSLDQVPKDVRQNNTLLSEQSFPKVLEVLEKLKGIADKYHKTLAQTALRWLLDKEGITAVIAGASSAKQVDLNLGAFGWSLESQDSALLDQVSEKVAKQFGPHESLWSWHSRK